jgi:hypothetical protein
VKEGVLSGNQIVLGWKIRDSFFYHGGVFLQFVAINDMKIGLELMKIAICVGSCVVLQWMHVRVIFSLSAMFFK